MSQYSPKSTAPVEPLCIVAGLPWLRVVLLAFGVSAAAIASMDGYLRFKGARSNVTDSRDLWYFWRHRVYCNDRKAIVFLGTSRIMADISLATMHECLPEYCTVQLGLNGAESCIGLLKDLAEDSAFRGIVVCELDTPLLERSLWLDHQDYQSYEPRTFGEYVSAIASAFLADRSVLLRRTYSIREAVCRFLTPGARPLRETICMSFQRETRWHFSELSDVEGLRLQTTMEYQESYARRRFPAFCSITRDICDIEAMIQAIKARGGNVVFLRAPSSGHRWQLEQRYHPKASNWDRFAAATSGCCIHFWDHPAIAAFHALTSRIWMRRTPGVLLGYSPRNSCTVVRCPTK